MYYPYKGGAVKEIGFDTDWYEVNVPPVGYVPVFPKREDGTTDYTDYENRVLEERPIINKNKERKDQKWIRSKLPDNYKKLVAEEKRMQKNNPQAFIRELQHFRNQEWDRRLHGCWVMIDGEAIYLTGLHYYHLNRRFDFGYPDLRFPDLDVAYLLQWVIENPNCFGMMWATLRRRGKTSWASSFLMEPITRLPNQYAGIQAQTRDDAKEQFEKAVVLPWKFDYDFWRPKYDYNSQQKTEINFRTPSVKGKSGLDLDSGDDDALYSKINYRGSGIYDYDGQKLHRYLREESGKTTESDINKGWSIVKPCFLDKGKIIGKAFYPTTVEELEDGGDKFIELWKKSDPKRTNKLGRTPSGMIRFFSPAYEGYMFDEYGRPLIEESKEEILAERESLQDDAVSLSDYIRKFPFTWEEAIMSSSTACIFNAQILNKRYAELVNLPPSDMPYTRGNFEWSNGLNSDVIFVANNTNGRFYVHHVPDKDHVNKVNEYFSDGKRCWEPLNDKMYRAATDPIQNDIVVDGKPSMAAGMVFWKFDLSVDDPSEAAKPFWRSHNIACVYNFRPMDVAEYFDDMIKMCRFYGCQLHVETQKNAINHIMKEKGYGAFLSHRPDHLKFNPSHFKKLEEGTPNSNEAMDVMIEDVKLFVNFHGHRIPFPEVVAQLIKFNYKKRREFDLVVCLSYLLALARQPIEKETDPIDLSKLIGTYD